MRNNEILRANNRDHSGINGEFLCGKGRFGFDFTSHPERIRQPLVRKNGKLEPASWEDALEEVARRLKQVKDKHGANAIGVIGSNHTTNEENYLLNRFARASLGTNNIDHHRTADYVGLAAALGPNAKNALAHHGRCLHRAEYFADWQRRDPAESAGRLADSHRRPPSRHAVVRHQRHGEQDFPPGGDRRGSRQEWRTQRGCLAGHRQGRLPGARGAIAGQDQGSARESLRCSDSFRRGIQGAAIRDLVAFGSRLGGQTKYMALGDYANSRGAADMGVLPDRLPGYASLADASERTRYGKIWGAEIPATPGLTARAMMEAAAAGKLKALYVVGANPVKTFAVSQPDRLAGLELLVVHDMFLTETAQRADIVLPAASTYEKDGTMTNTAGEVQMTHRSIDPQGPRTDFDMLRILSHQLGMLGLGAPIKLRTAEAAFEEIRQNVPGYEFPWRLAVRPRAGIHCQLQVDRKFVRRAAGNIFSSNDFLFTSGTLGRYCSKLTSTKEAKDTPWSSSPTIQSWWYR